MANMLMMRYAAGRGRNDGREMERDMMAGPVQPNHQVGTEQRMAEDREYRGNRNSRMMGDGMAENRYRGEDGRYKSGTRRNRMGGVEKKWEFSVKPQDYQVTKPGEEHLEPYQPDMRYSRTNAYSDDEMDYDDPPGRVIGFGAPRSHYGGSEMGSPHHMHRGMHGMEEAEFSKDDAEEWVDAMKNEDDQQPHGGKWDVAFVKPLAQKVGMPSDGPEFWEFYAVINSIYSDFCKVFNEYNFKNPMGYAKLAKAWIHDKDAVDDKVSVYYNCIVKPKMEEEG